MTEVLLFVNLPSPPPLMVQVLSVNHPPPSTPSWQKFYLFTALPPPPPHGRSFICLLLSPLHPSHGRSCICLPPPSTPLIAEVLYVYHPPCTSLYKHRFYMFSTLPYPPLSWQKVDLFTALPFHPPHGRGFICLPPPSNPLMPNVLSVCHPPPLHSLHGTGFICLPPSPSNPLMAKILSVYCSSPPPLSCQMFYLFTTLRPSSSIPLIAEVLPVYLPPPSLAIPVLIPT